MTRATIDRLKDIVSAVELVQRYGAGLDAMASEIPWGQIRGTRSNIVHGYWQVDFAVLTDTIRFDLEPLRAAAGRLIDLLERPPE